MRGLLEFTMEELISTQLVIGEIFDKMHSLTKNNMAELGREEYTDKALDALYLLWKNFEDNNHILIEAQVQEDNYFTAKIFEKVKEEYLTVMHVLDQFLHVDVPSEDSPAKRFADIPRSQRTMLMGHQRLRFTTLEDEIRRINIDDINDINEMEDWQKTLKQEWRSIERCHKIIKMKYVDMWPDLTYELNYVRYKNMYETTYSLFNYKIDARLYPVFRVIPHIGIPTWRMFDNASDVHPFAVTSLAWTNFDSLSNIIRNNKLTEGEKRHLLITTFLTYQRDDPNPLVPENPVLDLEEDFHNALEESLLLPLVHEID